MIALKKCVPFACRPSAVSRGTPRSARHLSKTLQALPPWRRGLLTQSYARGPLEPPLLESTIGDHFAQIVSAYGDRTAVICKHQNDRVTYAGLDAKSNALARGLESVGVRTGDRVGVMLGNSMEFSIATYALFKLGAILVPINPSFNAAQVVSALNHLEATHMIVSTESNLPRKEPRSNIPILQHLVQDLYKSKLESALVPSLKHIIIVDNSSGRVDTSEYRSLTKFSSVTSAAKADEAALPYRDLSPHDVVNIQFTSGTTAMPKAACLTHRSVLNNGSQIGDRMRLTPEDIVCCPPPLFHCFGSVLGYMATATHGSAVVFPTESFNARAALTAVQEERCTALYGVPTMFIEELTLIDDGEVPNEGFGHLRTGIAAGSSVPAALMQRLHKVLNLTELTICYGMTETSPVSAMTTTDDPIDKRINTVGRLMPHVEAKIVNPADRSQILPVGVPGELAVSGYLLMKEYWDDPQRTAESMIADDKGKVWMHTGDEATISPDGYVTITGRIKDLIIRGGENIHPLEIENCILTYPGVLDVSVVGVPDEKYGEVVAAFIIPKEHQDEAAPLTEENIREWVRGRLSNHLVPKYVFNLEHTTIFPKTASGKIQKFKLKEDAIKILKERNSLS
ncbi:AMP-binding enzyme [Aspergillus arachidicola]|uniref:AMP-binding enzyme n=1 Tax=Aspergillus arachidicola TaxID=656916 RepID=A0A2G7FUS6_9EURO|nr:AMP-binding enzyme [Aspergillus arachidicola]